MDDYEATTFGAAFEMRPERVSVGRGGDGRWGTDDVRALPRRPPGGVSVLSALWS